MPARRHPRAGRAARRGLTLVADFDVVAIGEPLYELNRQEAGYFLPGFGGDTLNVAIAAARLGSRSAYITRLGPDIFAAEIEELMRREGIAMAGVSHDSAAPTGLYFVTHGPQGHVFTYRRQDSAASLMTPANLDPRLIASADFLHASGISQAISASAAETVAAAIAIAKANGVKVSFDTNYRPKLWRAAAAREPIEAAAALTDILKTSAEDCLALLGITDPATIARHFLGLGAKAVIVTLGAEGVYAATSAGAFHAPGHKVRALDATGAGDAFTGALLAQLRRGTGFAEAVRFANVAAALSTLGYGAIAPLPGLDAVKAALAPAG